MKYAIISLNNNQYKITEGEEILVDKIDKNEIKPEILLVVDDGKVFIGEPSLNKAKVGIEYVGDEKGTKLHVRKFRSKSRYRKKIGFRPEYTRLKVEKITV